MNFYYLKDNLMASRPLLYFGFQLLYYSWLIGVDVEVENFTGSFREITCWLNVSDSKLIVSCCVSCGAVLMKPHVCNKNALQLGHEKVSNHVSVPF